MLGTGLLGGSVALALKEKGLVEKVVGTSRQESSRRRAVERGILDEASADIHKAIADNGLESTDDEKQNAVQTKARLIDGHIIRQK